MKVFAVIKEGGEYVARTWPTIQRFEMDMTWIDERIICICTSKEFLDGAYEFQGKISIDVKAELMMMELRKRYMRDSRKDRKYMHDRAVMKEAICSVPDLRTGKEHLLY